jgi:hypothetical protein
MKIVPVIFTYSRDGACAAEAAGALKDAGFSDVVVFEDAHDPVSDAALEGIGKARAQIFASSHPNPGGQYGPECLRGIATCYRDVIAGTSADYVLKVDSDTIVVKTARLRAAAADGVAAAGWVWGGWEFGGCCALISRRAANEVLRVATEENLPCRCPEDVTTARIAARVGEVRRWPYNEQGGFGAGYRYGVTPLEEHARRFDMVTFGNRHLLAGSDCDRREKVALTMARFRRVLRGMRQNGGEL